MLALHICQTAVNMVLLPCRKFRPQTLSASRPTPAIGKEGCALNNETRPCTRAASCNLPYFTIHCGDFPGERVVLGASCGRLLEGRHQADSAAIPQPAATSCSGNDRKTRTRRGALLVAFAVTYDDTKWRAMTLIMHCSMWQNPADERWSFLGGDIKSWGWYKLSNVVAMFNQHGALLPLQCMMDR